MKVPSSSLGIRKLIRFALPTILAKNNGTICKINHELFPPPPSNVVTMLSLSTVRMIPVALNIVWGERGFPKIAKTA